MQDQLSSLQQQVQNLQKATASGNRGRVNVTVKKPSFNCKCGANATVDVVYRGETRPCAQLHASCTRLNVNHSIKLVEQITETVSTRADCEDIAELLEAAVPGVYTVEPVTTTGRLVSVQGASPDCIFDHVSNQHP